ncbi:flagellar calcium-binding protein [Nitzschia inconspicua]|uniref:Flagellar calcium-binding protein n=1 Tax=Nitzschia inconspicua TaxID=303405 RepID=A0A9K3M1L9_9STRA|nr:flagellar calcium-binding protein [Nitzschia inconspicua]
MRRFYALLCRAVVMAMLVMIASSQNSYAQDGYDDYADYQDYAGGEYQDDSLYYDYAQRKESQIDGGRGGGGGMVGMGKLVLTGAVSWILGARVHTGRANKKLKRKHQSEQKKLYTQYYNDVYKLSEQNSQLQKQIEELMDLVRSTEAKAELEALQRDYDEFKQPDLDGDDRISRAEFNMYVKNYLSNYPGLSEKDYPKFDDFDHDGDGYVSFQEYSQQMALQAEQAELEQLYGGGSDSTQKARALQDLYNSAKGGSLYG